MGHSIVALITKGDIQIDTIRSWDLIVEELPFDVKLVYVDHHYAACWQKLKNLKGYLPQSIELPAGFPTEIVLLEIAKELKGEESPTFAIIYTDYFGGVGDQVAQIFNGAKLLDPKIISINQALERLGVKASRQEDEFDRIGLGNFRCNPDYLDKYCDMADELGL